MDRALIVCDNEKGTSFYKSFLKENGYMDMVDVTSGPMAKRAILDYDFDICIINGPIGGASGEELSKDIAEKNICQVILFVKAERLEEISAQVEDYGVITVGKPINKQLFWQALKLAKVAQRRINMAQKENEKLERKLADMKVISRAKILLMVENNISEEEAHKLIEKQAMDRRMTRIEIAREIVGGR
ncbi:ANTAR domain-containing response regulator [Pseudobutyrivibrio xylanivorans]|uniref:Response regulator receiver and ANTAR domain protein n=1 Tax=Pseudobutyrivibrio xylanivorans DSM 14809 TaxID=1123012 RepID=A0A1M6CHC1_PSEXY|nr:ANTAR domain-containing protein [Pseudobutyrivibrio xylanivorans]SHI60430.1 response regulator receiver and ANTAR domain protein [Pseudobutyrivibrio xylanivorans DSM 14809]